MTSPTPRSVSAARWAAAVQTVLLLVGAGLSAAAGIASYASDRAAAAAGNRVDFAGLAEFIAVGVVVICVLAAALLGVPAARLRAHRPIARMVLVVAEIVVAVPVAVGVPLARDNAAATFFGAVFVALSIAVLVALLRPAARRWADG